jgi:hypothetical protein
MKHKTLTIIGLAIWASASGQQITPPPTPQFPTFTPVELPNAPQPAGLGPNAIVGFPQAHAPSPGVNPQIQQQNLMLMQEAMRNQQQQAIFTEVERDMMQGQVRYELPDNSQKSEAQLYRQAFDETSKMLEGKQPLDLKRAIYLTENAWLGNMDYEWFCHLIDKETEALKSALKAEGHSPENNDAVKWMLSRFYSDTVGQHLPFRYDFEDPFGKESWTKMFVSRLLTTRKGQCHSMPLLYLLLAEEMGVHDAWLTHSPNHSYIKVRGSKGNIHNFETTNGHYTSDSWVLSSNFIKAEALVNDIYLDTLSKRELVASRLADLGMGYVQQFGYDKFVSQCAGTVLKYHPNDIQALQVEANYRTALFGYVVWQLNYPPPNTINQYPEAYELLRLRDEMYDKIDGMGYEPMPEEVYLQWLNSFESEKGKQPIEIIKP